MFTTPTPESVFWTLASSFVLSACLYHVPPEALAMLLQDALLFFKSVVFMSDRYIATWISITVCAFGIHLIDGPIVASNSALRDSIMQLLPCVQDAEK